MPCIYCKAQHDSNSCPLYLKAQSVININKKVSDSFCGTSPAPFVGRFGYPYVNVGILAPPEVKENVWLYDAPRFWGLNDFQIDQIVEFRSSLVNSRFKADINQKQKWLDLAKEIAMASKPVDLEINLKEKPRFSLNIFSHEAPTGPNAQLKKAEITSNTKISQKVEYVVNDIDLKANDAVVYLYDKGFDENFLSKLLSVGNIGIEENRKLVPTRWSITAVDDLLSKNLLKEVKTFDYADFSVYSGSYIGNYYIIMLFPDNWSYELFEIYLPKPENYSTDYEPFQGRKYYAENCVGGYYTVRLAIAEKLKELKKQASVLVLRFITNEYSLPLGVWVTREASRKSINNAMINFSSKELLIKYVKDFIIKKFNYDIKELLEKSVLLKNLNKQKKLSEF